MSSTKPFAGVTVLDFSRVLAGPFCTAMLADLGAEIIKVEPPTGDDQRSMGAFSQGISVSFELINRNKRSIRLDLKSEEGRAIARRLAARSDVVVENFRPGVASKLGIDAETLRGERADLIYCSISGFGQDGPLARAPSYDVVAQALSGLMSITGEPDGEPMMVGDSVGDTVSGLYAGFAIAAALYRRATTGEGATLDIAMFDSLFSLLPTALAQLQVNDQAPTRQGNQHPLSAPFGAFAAKGGTIIIAIANNSLFARFAATIGRSELADDPRYASDRERRVNRDALRAEIEFWSRDLSPEAAVERLAAAGIPASVVWDVAEAADSAHARHRRLMTTVEHDRLGRLRLPEQPVHVAGLDRGEARPAPELGEHGGPILQDMLDMDAGEIARLRAAGVI